MNVYHLSDHLQDDHSDVRYSLSFLMFIEKSGTLDPCVAASLRFLQLDTETQFIWGMKKAFTHTFLMHHDSLMKMQWKTQTD